MTCPATPRCAVSTDHKVSASQEHLATALVMAAPKRVGQPAHC